MKTELQITILAAILVPGTLLAGHPGGKHAPARPTVQHRPQISHPRPPAVRPVNGGRQQGKGQYGPAVPSGRKVVLPNPNHHGHNHHPHGHHHYGHGYRYYPVATSVVVYNEVPRAQRPQPVINYIAPVPAGGSQLTLAAYGVPQQTVASQRRVTLTGKVTQAVKGFGEDYCILDGRIRCDFQQTPQRAAYGQAHTGRWVAITGTMASAADGSGVTQLVACDSPTPL